MKARTLVGLLIAAAVVGAIAAAFTGDWRGGAGGGIAGALLFLLQGRPKTDPQKEGDDAKAKVLADDPAHVVAGLDDDARRRIDEAKRAGVDAGVDAAREALHGGGGAGRGQGGGAGGG